MGWMRTFNWPPLPNTQEYIYLFAMVARPMSVLQYQYIFIRQASVLSNQLYHSQLFWLTSQSDFT